MFYCIFDAMKPTIVAKKIYVIKNHLFLALFAILCSCVNEEMYDVDEVESFQITRYKRTKGEIGGSLAPTYFGDKECVAWALCYLKEGSRDITRETKNIVAEHILMAYNINITREMRRDFLFCSEEYKNLVNGTGVYASKIPVIANSLGLGNYDTINVGLNHGSNVRSYLSSKNNFNSGDILVRTSESSSYHVWVLNSATVSNEGMITCSDHTSSGQDVNINNVIGFIAKN